MKILLLLATFVISLFSIEIRVASYNVENLFDTKYDGTEYKEYIPSKATNWTRKIYLIKLNNIAKVISAAKPDIIGLEEIESKEALLDLRKTLRKYHVNYRYYAIASKKRGSVTTALLSKYPIKYIKEVEVTKHPRNRNILEVGINVKGETLVVFVNHWKAKTGPESKRIIYAKTLMKRLQDFDLETPYILLGDFNSDYNEFDTFKKQKRLNDTDGKTGINHVLNTVEITDWKITRWFKSFLNKPHDVRFVTKEDLAKSDDDPRLHYNLWLELKPEDRWSYKSGKKLGTLDNIIIPKALVDGKGLEYKDHSFQVFRGAGTVRNGRVYRWKKSKGKHIGKGFSDHLLIYADLILK